eukprot:Gregarina_sp_Pseudo_9__1719@NODE_2166_length_1117_cov_1789_569573_g1243_i3_p2_GENE_NODE_2166_length_1117_cov_1789_569573_g1243_i3NODE_2166_length_1117_cov_1789_569573_g1243_i3_p2_ORF_typecomplete_len107_score5_32Aldedh/PF00171_22/0_015Staph_haemo/PF05480_11/0_18Staph_haemo/PF05480_11/1_8e03_NODE_2166_length_1117_cov_1789_569573_g1243_i3180500
MPHLHLPNHVEARFDHPGFPTPTPSQKVNLTWSCLPLQPLKVAYPERATKDQIAVEADCLFDSIDDAVSAAVNAQTIFSKVTLSERKKIILAIRQVVSCFKEDFAW